MSDLNRRDFVSAAAALAAATCVACTCCEAEAADAPAAAAPNEPLDFGTVKDYPKDGTINDKYAKPKEIRIIVIRHDGKIYAANSTCTHKNCGVKAGKDNDIICPCHNSKYSLMGVPTKGPAKAPLFRYGISVGADGKIQVDKTKQFGEKDWDKEGAFIKV
jgi:Rieske Fe-S protein